MKKKDIKEEQLTLDFSNELIITKTAQYSNVNSADVIQFFSKYRSQEVKKEKNEAISRILQQADKYSW